MGYRFWNGGWNVVVWECLNIRLVILEDFFEDIIIDEIFFDGLVFFGDWRDMGCSLEFLSWGVEIFGDFFGVEIGFGDKVVIVNGIFLVGIEIMGEGDKILNVFDLCVGGMD